MATLTPQTLSYAARKTFRAVGTDKAVVYLEEVMAAVAGSASGEDALTVLNRKLESDGVLSTGNADPIFATEDALFFYNTVSTTLFIRTSTHYEALITEEDIVQHGTTTPVPSVDTAWIVLRTDTPKRFFLKERLGSPGSYTYNLQGPFFAGSYQLRFIYSAQDSPVAASVTWNWENANFNISGGDWATNTPNPKWFRIVGLPNDSDEDYMTPLIRIGDPVAADITYTRPNRDGNLPSSVNNLQELGDAFHDYTPPAAPTTPTTGDSEVQVGEFTSGFTYSNRLGGLAAVSNIAYHDFSLDTNLRNLVSTYGTALSISASASFTTQSGSIGDITIAFGVADNSNDFYFSDSVSIHSPNARTTRAVRTFGNLPSDFRTGRFVARVTATSGTPIDVAAGIDSVKFRIEPDEDASSVPVDRTQFGDNIPSDDPTNKTVQDSLEILDDLPLSLADTYDLSFEGPPDGIDDNGIWVIHRLPLARLIPIRNARPLQAFTGKLRYNASYIPGSRGTPPPETVNFTHRVWSNVPDDYVPATHGTQLDALTYLYNQDETNQDATATTTIAEVSIPNDCDEITIGFKSNSGQDDARLLITDYDFDIEKGIDSSVLDGNLTDNVRSLQSLAQAVDDLALGGSTTAANVSVDNTQFDNAQTDPGGLLDQSINITNAQQAFNVIDDLNQAFEDPFKVNQVLDFGATTTNAGTINSGTPLRTNDIDIDSDLRALSADVAVRIKIRVSSITADFDGNVSIVDGDNPGTRYGDLHPVNGSGVNALRANDFIILQRIIPAAQVPVTVQVQWNRTSSVGSATFDRGKAYMVIFPTAQTGGMGQSVTVTEAFMWTAGALANSRQTGTGPYTLLAGHTWPMYHILEFGFDNGTNAGMYKPMAVFSSTFQASGSYGTMDFTDFIGYNVKPVGTGDNQFEFVWGNRGIRHVKGFRIVIN